MLKGGFTPQSEAILKRDLQLLTLDKKKKKAILKESVQQVRKEQKQNIKAQKQPDGQPFTPRKTAKTDSKGRNVPMLKHILRRSRIYYLDDDNVKIGYNNAVSARIAKEHHEGLVPEKPPIKPNAKAENDTPEEVVEGGKATINQALKLIEAGFTMPANPRKTARQFFKEGLNPNDIMDFHAQQILKGKNRRKASVAYIRATYTFEQAGVLLRRLWELQGRPKKNSPKPLPARPFTNNEELHNLQIVSEAVDKVIKLK